MPNGNFVATTVVAPEVVVLTTYVLPVTSNLAC